MRESTSAWSAFGPIFFVLLSSMACLEDRPPSESRSEVAQDQRDFVPKDGDEALAWLLEGNARFATDRPYHGHEGARRRAMLSSEQHPAATVLACADSRVPPELVFDAGLGDLFVIRVAGNVVANDELGSIEYAVLHLETPLLLVLGHEGCGAVTAALESTEDEPVELSRLLDLVKPALQSIDPTLPHDERVHLGVEANVRRQVERLREVGRREGAQERLPPGFRVVGGIYELETGRVRILDEPGS